MSYHIELTAMPDGDGTGNNLQEMLEIAAEAPSCSRVRINLLQGTYSGQFNFDGNRRYPGRKGVKLDVTGAGMRKTVLTGSLEASDVMPDGTGRGLFRSYTACFAGPELMLSGMTIENKGESGKGDAAACGSRQAMALYSAADMVQCRRLCISGGCGTLFLAPLPEAEMEDEYFQGPESLSVRKPTIQVFERCEVSGIDEIIMGGASAVFRQCGMILREDSREGNAGAKGWRSVAAPCAEPGSAGLGCSSMLIFDRCSFECRSPRQKNAYLASPWRPYGRCLFSSCSVGDGFAPELWHVRLCGSERQTAGFYTAGMGVDAAARDWGPFMSDAEKAGVLRRMYGMVSSER